MEELKSPPPCPNTVTVRRNPHRRARGTPFSNISLPLPLSSPSIPREISPFPLQDDFSTEVPKETSEPAVSPENLKVFLRIRPLAAQKLTEKERKAWPKNPKSKSNSEKMVKKKGEICLKANDSHSVMLLPPQKFQDSKRVKSEVYEGFSQVFSAEASQSEVYENMVNPLVEEFLKGKSGMLAALGPTGSGKTHTIFGCIREPGMVPLALRHIFCQGKNCGTQLVRRFYLSMFEICSEKGKSERLRDLLGKGVDPYLQQSAIKGLQEVFISDAQQAEVLIERGMLKRATATTNSNKQSSRSQCIINIHCGPKKFDGEIEDESTGAVLTIVDLAGAEREKKTGNQGLRLLESNFINNTSMVFGLCLRSLLEHQKNPKKPLQKHFQNSMLTRYLKAYLEGKKRMALVLTVKPGEEDYLDTSYLLKQASPFAQIKFSITEEPVKIKSTKRPIQTFPRGEQLKRMKFTVLEASVVNERIDEKKQMRTEKYEDGNVTEVLVQSEELVTSESNQVYLKGDPVKLARRDKEHQITLNFAKAMWKVLKEYNVKLKMAENELSCLRENLSSEKKRFIDLENEMKDLKYRPSTWKEVSADLCVTEFDEFEVNHSPDIEEHQATEVKNSCPIFACNGAKSFTGQHFQQPKTSCVPNNDGEDLRDSKQLGIADTLTNNGSTSVWTATQSHANKKSKEAAGNAGHVENVQGLQSSKEEDHLIDNNIRDIFVLKEVDRGDTSSEIQETDHSESAFSSSQSCGTVNKICPSSLEKELVVSVSTILESVVSSSLSPVLSSEDDSLVADTNVLPRKDCNVELVSDPSESAVSSSESFDTINKICPSSPEKESVVSVSTISESVVSSSLSLVLSSEDDSLAAETNEFLKKECKKELDPPVTLIPNEDESFAQGCEGCNAPEIAPKLTGSCNSLNIEKPKRRLLPASSILLKDIGNLTLENESGKTKGAREEQKVAVDLKEKTKGSISLLRLLRSDL